MQHAQHQDGGSKSAGTPTALGRAQESSCELCSMHRGEGSWGWAQKQGCRAPVALMLHTTVALSRAQL